ncbi:MAG: phosphoenolpyruvate kinase [Gemmatimonadota bacterium]
MTDMTPGPTLPDPTLDAIVEPLRPAYAEFLDRYPGEAPARQPVHTVYGGAHLFRSDSGRKLGDLALRFMDRYAPDFVTLARALRLSGFESLPHSLRGIESLEAALDSDPEQVRRAHPAAWLAHTVYRRVRRKLEREPVEDFRIDFEDGFGTRPEAEEDRTAAGAAREVARGMVSGTLPPFIGIRIKPLSRELAGRGLRTLDLFLTTLVSETGGELPDRFVVTLPKVVIPEQVVALADALGQLESRLGIAEGSLKLELMVEMPQSIFAADGTTPLPSLVEAGRGRCIAAHFGVYDYTASCSITAEHQRMRHDACDLARQIMLVSLAGRGIWLSDGATNVLPVAIHRETEGGSPLSDAELLENRESVHRAWRLHFDDVRHSLVHAFYQGWDLHPAQLVTRYAALYSFFLEGLDSAAARLKHFVKQAALATLHGDVFDDAATGQGLLNFFLRGLNCGAISEQEASRGGLSLEELRGRSFVDILADRGAP